MLVTALTFEHVQGPQYYQVGDPVEPRAPMVGLTRFGLAVGRCVVPPYEADTANLPRERARVADEADLRRAEDNDQLALDSTELCVRYTRRHNLPMKVLHCFWSLDRHQVAFFYTAPQRVDFRGLLRDLTREFRTPIRLEQIRERDAARLLGGLGRCGRELCCKQWLPAFHGVAVRQIRGHDADVTPSYLAGVCGKPRCCLRFEDEDFVDLRNSRACCASYDLPIKTASYHGWEED